MRRNDIDLTTYWMHSRILMESQRLLNVETVELPPTGRWTHERVQLVKLAMYRIDRVINDGVAQMADVVKVSNAMDGLIDPESVVEGDAVFDIVSTFFKMLVRGTRRRAIVQRTHNAVEIYTMKWEELACARFYNGHCELSRPCRPTTNADYCQPDFASIVVTYMLRAARGHF